MSATRIQAELMQFEAALRPAYDQRAALRSASVRVWDSCLSSLLSVAEILETSSFAEESGGSKWVRWRKSNSSKQLIGLLRSAIEAAAAMPAFGSSVSANRSTTSAGVSSYSSVSAISRGATAAWGNSIGANRSTAAIIGSSASASTGASDIVATQLAILLIHQFYLYTQNGSLWPALREWLSDDVPQHGLQDLWKALAWSLEASKHALCGVYSTMRLAVFSVRCALLVSLCPVGLLPRHLMRHPSLVAALRLVMGSALPGLINFAPYVGPDSEDALEISLSMLDSLTVPFAQQQGAQLLEQLHPVVLSLWTEAVAAVRQWPQKAHLCTVLRVR